MVFVNLPQGEKDAFFSLLDEYFSSRPDIFANAAQSSTDGASPGSAQGAAAMSAVHRAMASNPEATAKVMSAGLRHVANSRGVAGGSAGAGTGAGATPESEAAPIMAGRVAAASLAFSAARNNHAASPPPVAEKSSSMSNLSSVKKFGNVDTSSAKGFLGSLRNNDKGPSPPPPAPAAFAPRQNNFAPPPARRAPSSVSAREPTPEPPAPPQRYQAPQQDEEEEEQGEWVEALYEYNSGEAGDLLVREGDRILLMERTSDDWWTGEVNGKKGLFPASYVKLL